MNGRQTCADALNGHGLGLLGAGWEGLLRLVEASIKEGIDERGFSETGFTLKRRREGQRGFLVAWTGRREGLTDDHGSELEALPYALPVNLVGKVGETDETHEFLANHRRRGKVLGRDERGIGWATIAVLRDGVAVAAGVVRHVF